MRQINFFQKYQRYFSIGGFVLFLVIVCYYFSKPLNKTPGEHLYDVNIVADTSEHKSALLDTARECLIRNFDIMDKHPTSWWIHVSATVKECAKDIVNYVPYIEGTPNMAEHKYYMVPRAEYINSSCSVVTFGIGGEILSEQHIKRAIPQCTFLGFDPDKNYQQLFDGVLGGKFVQTAVAGKTGVTAIMQRLPEDYGAVPNVTVRSAAELIETYHGTEKLVDILNIDVEASEYSIFESIIEDKIFQNVCQFNVEIHPVWFHDTGYSYYDAIKIFKRIIQDGTFIWVQAAAHSGQFYPSYFVNVKNERCIAKYLKGRLL